MYVCIYSVIGIIIISSSHVNLLFSSTICLSRGCPRDVVQAAPTRQERPFWRPWKPKPSSCAEIGTTQTQSLTNSRVSLTNQLFKLTLILTKLFSYNKNFKLSWSCSLSVLSEIERNKKHS